MKIPVRMGLVLLLSVGLGLVLYALPAAEGTVTAAPPLSGAIFTTNMNGTRVNQNHYNDKCEVYLDGGPGDNAPQWAAGLPDGDYYFQVSDPSGKKLLSTDPVVNRQFAVSGGIISGLSGLGNHNTGLDVDHGGATIQLCPYLDTPNPGGVYKVWVTRVEDFVGDPFSVDSSCGRGCFHGFIPAASKTDNWKVDAVPSQCLQVEKFFDYRSDGGPFNPAEGDRYFTGWPMNIYGPLGDQINGTLFTPTEVCNLEPGTYRVVEGQSPLGNFFVTGNYVDGVALPNPDVEILVRIRRNDPVHVVTFENSW